MKNKLIGFTFLLLCFGANLAVATSPSEESTYPVFSFAMLGKERVMLNVYGGTYLINLKDKSKTKIANRGTEVNFDGEKLIAISFLPQMRSSISKDFGKNWKAIELPIQNKKCGISSKFGAVIPEKKSFDLTCGDKIYHTNDYGYSWKFLTHQPKYLKNQYWFLRSQEDTTAIIVIGKRQYLAIFDRNKKRWIELTQTDFSSLRKLGLKKELSGFVDMLQIDNLMLLETNNDFYLKNLQNNEWRVAAELSSTNGASKFQLLGRSNDYWILQRFEFEGRKLTLYRYDKSFKLSKIVEFEMPQHAVLTPRDMFFDSNGDGYILVDEFRGRWTLFKQTNGEKTWKAILDQNNLAYPE